MIQLLPITTQASPYWDSLVRIYHDSFPIDEQRPVESIARLIVEEPRYTLYAIVNAIGSWPLAIGGSPDSSNSFENENRQKPTANSQNPIGLLTTWHFDEFTYIEHFAINTELRSQGYGSKAISTLIKQKENPIVLEAEPPTDELTRRRIRFYERQGLTLYDFHYLQPAYTEASQPVELRLMGTLDTNATTLTDVSNTLHREVYGAF